MGGSRLKKPGTPGRVSAKPFYRKDEGGAWLVVADFLVSESFAAVLVGQVTMFL